MKRLTLPLALSFGMSMAVLAPPVLGQERVVHRGNTEIVFEPASPADIPIDRYKTFAQAFELLAFGRGQAIAA